MIVSTSGSLGRGSVGDTVARAGVKAEQLGTDSLVLEAGASAAVLAALGVQGEQLARQHPGQRLLLVWRVVHTRGRLPAEMRIICEPSNLEDSASELMLLKLARKVSH